MTPAQIIEKLETWKPETRQAAMLESLSLSVEQFAEIYGNRIRNEPESAFESGWCLWEHLREGGC